MRLLDYAYDYPLHKVPCAHGCPVGYAAMVMPCLSDHMTTAITWYKYHMRVVILVAMMPYYAYGYGDAYPTPSCAQHMVQASYGHEYPYVYGAMAMPCVSYPMVMGTL